MTASPSGDLLRVGCIDFANCTPLFMALEELGTEGVEFIPGVPTELNHLLRVGGVDISPSSSVAFLRDPVRYGFLPDLSISAIGPVQSVLLFSRVPLEDLDGRPVILSPVSATSVVLLRVLLERHAGVTPKYVPEGSEEGGGEPAASLWIGDRALRHAKDGGWPHIYDLGELWFRATGTPFVFALWICRREAYQSDPRRMQAFYRSLVRARHLAYRSYPAFATRSKQAEWLGAEALLDYWQTISYDLTAWHLKGLRRFAAELADLGELPGVPDLTPVNVEG